MIRLVVHDDHAVPDAFEEGAQKQRVAVNRRVTLYNVLGTVCKGDFPFKLLHGGFIGFFFHLDFGRAFGLSPETITPSRNTDSMPSKMKSNPWPPASTTPAFLSTGSSSGV